MVWKKILLEDDPVGGATAEEIWTYSNRSLTDKGGFGFERLGSAVIAQYIDVGVPVTIIDITGGGIATIYRHTDRANPRPRITIDGVVQDAPFDGSTNPYAISDVYGASSPYQGFWLPIIPFKNSLKYEELNFGSTDGAYVTAIYGTKVVKREVWEDEDRNAVFEYLEFDTGAKIRRLARNLRPVERPDIEPLENVVKRIENKIDELLERLKGGR